MSLHDSSRRHLSTEDWLRAVFEEGRRRKNRDHTPRTLQPDGSQTTEDWLREVVFGTERPEAQALAQIAAAPAAKTPLTPEEQHSPTPYGWGTTLFPGRQAMDRLRAIAAQETPRDAGGRVPVSKTLLTADAGKTASDAGGKPEESAADASGASQRTWRDELLRGLGLGARGVTDGVLNVADTIALPARVPLNLVNGWAGGDPDYFKTLAGNVPDAIGLPHPETDLENIAYHMNSAMASTLATWGLGSLLGMGGKASTMPTTSQSIGRALTAHPLAQGTSAAASGAALGVAQNAGAGPTGQLAASVLGGMIAPGGGTKGTNGVAGARGTTGFSKASGMAKGLETAALEPHIPLKTTNHETGVTGLSKANQMIMNSPDWQAAKRGLLPEAQKVVEQIWTPEQTAKLRTKLQPGKGLAFVSVPSTSRRNVLPDALGQKLAGELGGAYVDVKGLYKVHAEDAMKDLSRAERPFAERSYEVLDSQALAALRNKQVVLTEDVLTTGSSARRFALELRRQGVEVQTVAGLMGDARLDSPPQLLSRLQSTLKNAGMNVKGRSLTEVLSAGEIDTIIGLITTGGPHERRTLAEKLQRLLDTRTAGSLGKHPR